MKYIRTKDGVYELKVNEKLKAQKTSNYFYINDKRFTCNLLLDEQYVKKCRQANTIEELCDCKVYIPKNKNETPYLEYPCRKYDYLNERYEIVYGAIWTSKGLIYVAKMNYKGELELL